MAIPSEFSYTRYLAAKKTVDDRALNRQVFEALARALKARQKSGSIAILEVGCGIGTMLERWWDWEVLANAHYTAVDLVPENIAAAATRLLAFAHERGLHCEATGNQEWLITSPRRSLTVSLEAADALQFTVRERGRRRWDLLLAHAVLDLLDLDTVVPLLFSLIKPEGWFSFTLNFDGATIFLPVLDPSLDALVEKLYHGTMDSRLVEGKPSGSSLTGRRLFSIIPNYGGAIIAAGSSDWVVFPGPEGYPHDEAYFLHYLVHTVEEALGGHPLLEKESLSWWASQRRQQIARGELVYMAHQLDFFGIKQD